MKIISIIIIFLSTINLYTQEHTKWIPLLNNNLEGWTLVDPPAKIVLKDSILTLKMTAHTSRHAYFRTEKKYKNFIFEVEFRREGPIDSGVLFRAEKTSDSAYSGLYGYMVKIDPSFDRLWTGGLFTDFGNGHNWLQTLEDNDIGRYAEKPLGEWNKLRIEVINKHIKVWLNSIPTVNVIDDKYKNGYIAFKIHFLNMSNAEKEAFEIQFKNPKILLNNLKKYSNLPILNTIEDTKIKYFR